MAETVQLIAKMVVILSALCAMVMLGMHKAGNAAASFSNTKYTPDSAKNLQSWSRTTKLIHLGVFVVAAIVGFWPA